MLFYLFAMLVGCFHMRASSPVKAINLFRDGKLPVFGASVKEGELDFYCLIFSRRRLLERLSEYGVEGKVLRLCGLPGFFWRYRWRVGAFIGVGLAVSLTYLSSSFLWQIDVVGNERLSDEEVLSILAGEGVFEGAYTGKLDPLAVANRCVMKSDDLAWMSVNIIGNKAEAVVVEYTEKELAERQKTPSNVVATKSGIVKRVELVSGVAAVGEGSVVREGQLLISGVNLLRNETYIYQPAEGKVFAETLNEITVEKSVNSEEKVYTGEVFREKSYIFFTKSKKISQDSGNLPPCCDRIEKKKRVMLFDVIPLPIWTLSVEYREFTYCQKTVTENEARSLATSEAWSYLAEGELVWAEESYTFDGQTARVTLRYRMVEDIAKELPLFDTP